MFVELARMSACGCQPRSAIRDCESDEKLFVTLTIEYGANTAAKALARAFVASISVALEASESVTSKYKLLWDIMRAGRWLFTVFKVGPRLLRKIIVPENKSRCT